MNYLAHLALSGDDMEVAFGNFIGDGVKGAIPQDLPLPVQVGPTCTASSIIKVTPTL